MKIIKNLIITMLLVISSQAVAQDALTILQNGNVGVNTDNPDERLTVKGNIKADRIVSNGDIEANGSLKTQSIRDVQTINSSGLKIDVPASGSKIEALLVDVQSFGTVTNARQSYYFKVKDTGAGVTFQPFVIRGDGNVGIGTYTPDEATLVVKGSRALELDYVWLANKSDKTGTSKGTNNYSIYASDRIAATEFNAFSDERIKDIIGRSNNIRDLETLSKIEITNYKFIDSIAKGNQVYKKVIAQQVERVYPAAVNNNLTQVIPNIYELGTIYNGWISSKAKDIAVGDKIKLIFRGEQLLADVLETGDDKFKVNCAKQGAVFVYGKQVSDFRTVDYEAIAMLNVSATQALLKRIDELENENNSTIKALNLLKEQQTQYDLRLQKLEQLLVPVIAEK